MTWIELTHADQTQISQIRLAVFVPPCEIAKLFQVSSAIERHLKHLIFDE